MKRNGSSFCCGLAVLLLSASAPAFESITLQSDDKGDAVTLLVKIGGVEQKIECGHASWKKGRMAYGPLPEQPAAVSGAWSADAQNAKAVRHERFTKSITCCWSTTKRVPARCASPKLWVDPSCARTTQSASPL